jgi:hypothetical protein
MCGLSCEGKPITLNNIAISVVIDSNGQDYQFLSRSKTRIAGVGGLPAGSGSN